MKDVIQVLCIVLLSIFLLSPKYDSQPSRQVDIEILTLELGNSITYIGQVGTPCTLF